MNIDNDAFYAASTILVSLIAFWSIPALRRHQASMLGVTSAVLLAMISPRTLVVPVIGGLTTFFLGKPLRENRSGYFLILSMAVPLGTLLCYQYFLPAAQNAGWIEKSVIPLGLSYYTFKQLHFLLESHRGNFSDATLGSYLSYLLYFPMFIAGPIERYSPFKNQVMAPQRDSLPDFSLAFERICSGLIKKLLISDIILAPFIPEDLSSDELMAMEWHQLVLISFIKFLRIYMDFSGYTDMAIGVSLLFGIRLMENFNHPLRQSNLAEFWRAWHISLSGWARDYIYFPVLGRWRIPSLALILTMLTIGAWHSLSPGWLLWGLHHGIGLAVLAYYHRKTRKYKIWRTIMQNQAWGYLGIVTVWFYVSIGHALTFFPEDIVFSLQLYIRTWGLG
ncbi:MAG: MBOAT family O-acyltransferase [Alcanivorax sp.]|uniref:MBOAT family O-acyltransferase n=1 Tax=Alcanivorax sp. TaxID=1872427 RepID=UPI003DA79011